ncbi:hypothetical protein C8J57DRAFT_1362469 [Mycena rebaudengoi]|nr:hypothetical protein C8J57DRAFT_1362469 [Mycena rebaudengoi]
MRVTIYTEIEPPEQRPCPPLPLDGPLLLEWNPCYLSTSVCLSGSLFSDSTPLSTVMSPSGSFSPSPTLSDGTAGLKFDQHPCFVDSDLARPPPSLAIMSNEDTASPRLFQVSDASRQICALVSYLWCLLYYISGNALMVTLQRSDLHLFGYSPGSDGIVTSPSSFICATFGVLRGFWPIAMILNSRGYSFVRLTAGALRGVWPTVIVLRGYLFIRLTSGALRGVWPTVITLRAYLLNVIVMKYLFNRFALDVLQGVWLTVEAHRGRSFLICAWYLGKA